jgi:hypothetical protein
MLETFGIESCRRNRDNLCTSRRVLPHSGRQWRHTNGESSEQSMDTFLFYFVLYLFCFFFSIEISRFDNHISIKSGFVAERLRFSKEERTVQIKQQQQQQAPTSLTNCVRLCSASWLSSIGANSILLNDFVFKLLHDSFK